MRFASLHSHTSYSNGDGVGTVEQHFDRAEELGLHALAMTEHGNITSHVQAEIHSKRTGVKALFGVEAYWQTTDAEGKRAQPKNHLTVLASNEVGYRNLMRLVTQSYKDFHYYPTVTPENFEAHHEGLIVLSGCSDSELSCALLGGKGTPKRTEVTPEGYEAARAVAQRFLDMLGDRYYLEVQMFPGLPRTCLLNTTFARLGAELGIPLAVGTDAHITHEHDNDLRQLSHAMSRGGQSVAKYLAADPDWDHDITCTYPTSEREIIGALTESGLDYDTAVEAMVNTVEIADRCDVTLPKADLFEYPVDDPKAALLEAVNRGWKFRSLRNPSIRADREGYAARARYELDVINSKGFDSYFLLMSDLVTWAKGQGIVVGPARGSAASSLIAYFLRITEIDPLHFPIMKFERFIDASRDDLPDIDVDFEPTRRDEVRQYAIDTYGEAHVAKVGNVVKYRGKNSLDDVARAYEIPKHVTRELKRMLIERAPGDERFDDSLSDTLDANERARELVAQYPDLLKAGRLQGTVKGASVHAGGVVISTTPITDVTAIYDKKGLGVLATDKYDAEHLHLMKADILGLSTLGVLGDCLKWLGWTLDDLYAIPLDDKKTMKIFARDDVLGIFQFAARDTRRWMNEVKPRSFADLVDINALSRPGPAQSGSSDAYIAARKNAARTERYHPLIDVHLAETHGQIVYQEQLLAVVRNVGGFSWPRTSKVRSIISKSKGAEALNEHRGDFIAGAVERGVPEEAAAAIWHRMSTSGSYLFVAAHSVAYTVISWWSAYMKAHHPVEFFAASLRKESAIGTEVEDLRALVADTLDHGIKINPPTYNAPVSFEPSRDGKSIDAGLQQIEGIGEKTAQAMRKAGPFESWADVAEVKGIGPKTIEAMQDFISSDDPFGLNHTVDTLNDVREFLATQDAPQPTHNGSTLKSVGNEKVVFVGLFKALFESDWFEAKAKRVGVERAKVMQGADRPDLPLKGKMLLYDEHANEVVFHLNRTRVYPQFREVLDTAKKGRDVVLVEGIHSTSYSGVQVERLYVLKAEK